ncbi:MAG: bifunctional DNA-formamidopyrimidine glycosylase/DNA-(apurinic or apyrimidinic site) lyase [Methylocystaceae bacterium]
MPELPEVETVRRTLIDLEGGIIRDYVLYTPSILKRADFSLEEIKGRKIKSLRRRGKFLLFDLGEQQLLVIHLGMSGRLFRVDPETEKEKHLHFAFQVGEVRIHYVDPRRFGGIRLINNEAEFFARMGPEPLGKSRIEGLEQKLAKRKSPIKTTLLDQSIVAGIGNIYADEILFAAGIDPRKPCADLNKQELKLLQQHIPRILEESIASRGTTFRDYRDGEGNPGDFAASLAVYGRTGEPCLRCGTPVESVRLGGRSTHYCPHCQH